MAKRKEHIRGRLAGVAVAMVASGIFAATSHAQTVPEEIDAALERCNRLEDPQARLACLRAIFEADQAEDRQTGNDTAPRSGEETPVPTERRTVPRGGIDESGRRGGATSGDRDAGRTAPRAAGDDFGLPPKIREQSDQPGLSSTVVWYDDVYKIGHPVFVLENGQVWQETEGKGRVEIPTDAPFRVTIAKGMFGDFQMKVEGKTGFMRVKRLK